MKLALGTVQFGLPYGVANKSGQTPIEEVSKILDLARENGIDLLDTAIAYGESEAVLGKLGVSDFKIITKLPPMEPVISDPKSWVTEQIKKSLKRLNVEHLYGVLLHQSKVVVGLHGAEIVEALGRLKEEGIVQKVGVSIYESVEIEPIQKVFKFDILQTPLNLIDRSLIMSGWLQRLHSSGVEIHARSAFLQGLLLMPRNKIPAKFEKWSGIWDSWHEWLIQHQTTAAAACLAFLKDQTILDKIIIGVESRAQLMELLDAYQSTITNHHFPNLQSDDKLLINPSNWNSLK